MFPMSYELIFHIPGGGIRHNHRRENLRSYNTFLDFLMSPAIAKSQSHLD
jgi:hypothetical protein